MMFGWIPAVLALFALFPPRRAVIISFLIAWLFLPMASFKLGGLPDYARGRVPAGRSVLRLVNSWHAVGPALVLVAAGQPEPTPRNLPIYSLALLAQFAFDFGSTGLRTGWSMPISTSMCAGGRRPPIMRRPG